MEKTTLTHKIVYSWEKIPFIVGDQMPMSLKTQLRLRNFLMNRVFNRISEVLFTAHKVKLKREDRNKRRYNIEQVGTKEQCERELAGILKIKDTELRNVMHDLPNKYRPKKVKGSNRWEKLVDGLAQMNIILEVKVLEI